MDGRHVIYFAFNQPFGTLRAQRDFYTRTRALQLVQAYDRSGKNSQNKYIIMVMMYTTPSSKT